MTDTEAGGRSITILYGSQTGTAREVAERFERMSRRRRFDRIVCMPLDSYYEQHIVNSAGTIGLARESLVCFVCATTGQGECPDNMAQFWRFLCRRSLPGDLLAKVQFAVCGLGDSSYESSYNFVGKRLYRRMLQLGAKELCRRVDCDEQHPLSLDGDLDPWVKNDFWPAVMRQWPLQPGVEIVPEEVLLPPKYSISLHDEEGTDSVDSVDNGAETHYGRHDELRPLMVRMMVNKRLTPEDHWQDVRHYELEIPEKEMKGSGAPLYNPGDVLAIMPRNPHSAAIKIAHLIGLGDNGNDDKDANVDQIMFDIRFPKQQGQEEEGNFLTFEDRKKWRRRDNNGEIFYLIPLIELFERYLDITGIPNKYFFEVMSHFVHEFPGEDTPDRDLRCLELEKALDRLQYFSSAEGTYDMYRYSVREKRSYIEVLDEFAPYVHLDRLLPYLLDIVPCIQARYFSISSSPSRHSNRVHITVAVVKFTTPMKRNREGFCSTWLRDLPFETVLPVWFRTGTLKLPKNDQTPLIMVGPGTGMAPFRSFYHERWTRHITGTPIATTLMFFGNRNRSCDFLYGDEMTLLESSTSFFRLFTAFSRDQEHKVYVQHVIQKQIALIWELIQQGAIVYVAGNSNQMPKNVKEAIVEGIAKESGMTQDEAAKFIKHLEQKKRYLVEAW